MNKSMVSSSNIFFLFRWSLREIRQGQLWLVTLALSLIIACVFALSALVARIEGIITEQGRSALTADLVLVSANPIDDSIIKLAHNYQLITAQQTRFGTMAFSDSAMQLVSVKAVSDNFPLKGNLTLGASADTTQYHHVAPHQLWLSERLFSLLDVNVGDSLDIGDTTLTISGRIVEDPELSFNPFSQMPSVLISHSDIEATGAIQPGGRISYRWYFSGTQANLDQFRSQVSLTASQRWQTEREAGRSGDFITRAEQYLSLTLVLVILMAAATLVLTCQYYCSSRKASVAMMKSLGAQKAFLWRWLLIQVALLFVLAACIGLSVGIALEWLLRYPLQSLLPHSIPTIGWQPAILSLVVAFCISLPALGIHLIRLVNIKASAAIDGNETQTIQSHRFTASWLLLLVPVITAIAWINTNIFVWLTLLGLLLLLGLLALFGMVALHMMGRVRLNSSYQLAVRRINRSKVKAATQLAALTSSLMLVAVIALLRQELLSDWQQTLPENAPNVFAVNIAPSQQQQYLQDLDQLGLERSSGYPVVRGRLTAINDHFFGKEEPDKGNAAQSSANDDEALNRELNFTWTQVLPAHNQLIQGEWGNREDGVSVESGIAKRLGIQLGDHLTFSVGSFPFTAVVTSIRDVEWRNMKPNFYFIFSPELLASYPAAWLVSFRIESDQNQQLNQLAEKYPTVSLLDLRLMANRIQGLFSQVSWSLSVLSGLGVVSGLMLIMTLLRLSLSERQLEVQLYRTLGASRKRISDTLWYEFGTIALLGGVIAAGCSEFVVGILLIYGFELPFYPHVSIWFILPLFALLLVYCVTRSQIKQLLKPLK